MIDKIKSFFDERAEPKIHSEQGKLIEQKLGELEQNISTAAENALLQLAEQLASVSGQCKTEQGLSGVYHRMLGKTITNTEETLLKSKIETVRNHLNTQFNKNRAVQNPEKPSKGLWYRELRTEASLKLFPEMYDRFYKEPDRGQKTALLDQMIEHMKEYPYPPETLDKLAKKCVSLGNLNDDNPAFVNAFKQLLLQGKNPLKEIDAFNLYPEATPDLRKKIASFAIAFPEKFNSVITQCRALTHGIIYDDIEASAVIEEINSYNTHPSLEDYKIQIENEGFTIKKAPSDGDCFYHSVAMQLNDQDKQKLSGNTSPMDAVELRQCLAGKMRQMGGFSEEQILLVQTSAAGKGGAFWGSTDEAKLLSSVLERPVIVRSPFENLENLQFGMQHTGKPPIYLIHNGTDHWDCLELRH